MSQPSSPPTDQLGNGSSAPAAGAKGRGGGVSAAPEWAVERVFGWLGRGPAALGKGLDYLAREGPWSVRVVVKVFSSVWTGLVWLFLTGLYVAVGSGSSALRAWLEVTELEYFNAWPMAVLMVLLATSMVVVTLRRIPLTVFKAGVWMVHIGVLVLLAGCFMYFTGKYEGSMRVFLDKPKAAFYDTTHRAFYVTRMDKADPTKAAGPEIMIPVEGLPYFYERLAVDPATGRAGKPLDIVLPAEALAADEGLRGLGIRITGYYPYANLVKRWTAGPEGVEGGVAGIELGRGESAVWLTSGSPGSRFRQMVNGAGLEYLYRPAAERVRDVEAEFAGSRGITVRMPKLGVERTYAAEEGKRIKVDGTPYVLTPRGVSSIAMMSKGYEGATAVMLDVDVERKDGEGKVVAFRRQAVFRYPERSPDWVKGADGKESRIQERVDNDIEIVFHDARHDNVWLVEDEGGKLMAYQRHAGGKVSKSAVSVGTMLQFSAGGQLFTLPIVGRTRNAVLAPAAQWVPPEFRMRRTMAAQLVLASVAEVEVSKGEWGRRGVAVPFVEYAGHAVVEGSREPAVVEVPGVGPVKIVMSTLRRELPFSVTLRDFDVEKYEGATNAIEDYVSTLEVNDASVGKAYMTKAQLNRPAEVHGLYLFQSAWDGDENAPREARFSVLGVGNRPGVFVMTLGSVLVTLGILYAFYVKPVLLNKRKRELAAAAGMIRSGRA